MKAVEFPLDEFFIEFGEDATYTDPDGVESDIQAVFDWAHEDTSMDGLTVENRDTKATVRTQDVPTVNNRSTLSVEGMLYKVAKAEPNASGITLLFLTLD